MNLQDKLRRRLEGKENSFKTRNGIAEIKQFAESVEALKERAKGSDEKIEQLQQEQNEEFGDILGLACTLDRYLVKISKLYPYV